MSAARILSTAAIALALVGAGSANAQDKGKGKTTEKAVVTEVLLENDKVRVTRSTFEPGAVSRADRKARTNYIVTNGTLERVTKDGKKTRYTRKAGTALYLEPDNDVVTNVGKTKYVVIGVVHK